MAFKPAKREALRTFVVLDSEAVLSGLAALDGGAVDEILTRTIDENASQIGGHIGGRGAKAQGGKNRGRRVEEELRRKRTEHSAAAALIDRLIDLEAIGEVDGELDEDVAAALTPGDTIRIRGEVALHPLHQVDVLLRSFIEAAPRFDQKETAAELRQALPIWESLIGSGKAARILFDVATAASQHPRIILPVKRSALQVEAVEVPGFCSVLAKIDRISGPEEHVLSVRILQNAPVADFERTVIEQGAVELVEQFAELGIPCGQDDVVMPGPLLTLRPICVWR